MPPYNFDLCINLSFVGTEANGLTQIWRDHSTKNINIPMQGEIDSMNVSVAAAVILFEAKRQRNFK